MSVLSIPARRIGVAVLVAATLAGGASREAGAQRRRNDRPDQTLLDTTLAIAKNGTVTVTANSGDVVVNGWSRDQVHVHGESDEGSIRVGVSASRSSIEVGSRGGGDMKFDVSVPLGVRVIVHSQSGDVSVRGTHGEVEVHTQSGDVETEDVVTRLAVMTFSGNITGGSIAGSATLQAVSGDVHLTDVRGDIDITTVSGEIGMRSVTAKVVRAKTTSGDVVYDGLIDAAGRYEFNTHSGDVRMHVQRDASAQISVSTWSGDIDSEFPMTLTPGEHGIGALKAKRFTFTIGGGAARITADTFNGDIDISSNGHGANIRR